MTRHEPQPTVPPDGVLDQQDMESVSGGRPSSFIPLPIEPPPIFLPIEPIEPIDPVPMPVPPVVELL